MTRQQTLTKYVLSHRDITLEQIAAIKIALRYYEEVYGELDDDYELEVQCAIEVYRSKLETQETGSPAPNTKI